MSLVRLDCPTQHYSWGSLTSLPTLLGLPNPTKTPWAEYWMGAHPKAPARLATGESLEEFIKKQPQERLGRAATLRGGELPFLFKILAASRPLSLQCHPNTEQAQAGFQREEAQAKTLGTLPRNYQDAHHKPELLVALDDFWALKGFKSAEAIAAGIERAALGSLAFVTDILSREGVQGFFAALLTCPPQTKAKACKEYQQGLDRLPADEARFGGLLLDHYPGDICALAPLFMHLVHLRPGQGMYVDCGTLHSYLCGTGLEIMASSDNVLRAGCTDKPVDVDELMKIVSFRTDSPTTITPTRAGHLQSYITPCEEFQLSVIDGNDGRICNLHIDACVIALSLGGQSHLTISEASLTLGPGQVAFCYAQELNVAIEPNSQLYLASIPGALHATHTN